MLAFLWAFSGFLNTFCDYRNALSSTKFHKFIAEHWNTNTIVYFPSEIQ